MRHMNFGNKPGVPIHAERKFRYAGKTEPGQCALQPQRRESDMYFYQPSQGHGLPHDPLNAIIGPRPIGWISSCDKAGQLNLAPYSFFNCFNYRPPIIGFSSNGWKDSVRNITETGSLSGTSQRAIWPRR